MRQLEPLDLDKDNNKLNVSSLILRRRCDESF